MGGFKFFFNIFLFETKAVFGSKVSLQNSHDFLKFDNFFLQNIYSLLIVFFQLRIGGRSIKLLLELLHLGLRLRYFGDIHLKLIKYDPPYSTGKHNNLTKK